MHVWSSLFLEDTIVSGISKRFFMLCLELVCRSKVVFCSVCVCDDFVSGNFAKLTLIVYVYFLLDFLYVWNYIYTICFFLLNLSTFISCPLPYDTG